MRIGLSKKQIKEREKIAERYDGARMKLGQAVDEFNSAIVAAHEKLVAAGDAYNDEMEAIRGWLNEFSESIADEIGGRSERWQESDAGQSAEGFRAAYAETSESIEDFDSPSPDTVEMPDDEVAIEELPEQPE